MKTEKLHNLLVRIAPFIAAWLMRFWFRTCKVREHGPNFRKEVEANDKACIATFWHYSLFFVFYHLRTAPAAVLVSASKDGDYVARFAHHLNFSTIRGSHNKRGTRALKELLTWVNRGGNAGMVADGSQGPARIAQAGSILLASRTGSPILPLVWSASHYITFKSWDKTAIPKPFSNVDFYYGKPIRVPPRVRTSAFENHRLELEESLNNLYHRAWQKYGKKRH